MTLVDANLLIYATDQTAAQHRRAHQWLEELLSGTRPVAFTWVVLLAYIRLTTNPKVFANPMTPAEAFDVVEGWLSRPCAIVVEPTTRHLAIVRGLIEPVGTAANLMTDTHLAALAIEHGAELASADHDFGRFPGLRWVNPLG